MKKNSKYILLGVIILLIIGSVVISRKKEPTQLADLAPVEVADVGQMCFLFERDAGSSVDQEGNPVELFDREYIQFSNLDDVTVTGIHNILPAEGEINRATFVGVQQDGYMNVIATANAEGEVWQEQRLYQINADKLFVGYQQVFVPQYQDENGIYFYEDLGKIVFETEEFFLDKVDCSTIDSNLKV